MISVLIFDLTRNGFLCQKMYRMRICVLADDQQKAEFLEKGIPPDIEIMWADTLKVMYSVSDIDVYFDLQFNHDRERLERLKKINGNLIFINDVNHTLM